MFPDDWYAAAQCDALNDAFGGIPGYPTGLSVSNKRVYILTHMGVNMR
jgi:hypothetical protein